MPPLEELIEQYYASLRKNASQMLRRYPSIKRWEETDDVVQLSLVRLIRSLESTPLESELHFRRLAGLQVRRMLIDLARSFSGPHGLNRNHETHYGNKSLYENLAVHDAGTAGEITLEDWEEFHLLVGELKGDDRDMFDLLWYSGLSVEAVAAMLGISVRSVQRRWRKARIEVAKAYRGQADVAGMLQ